MHSDRYRKWLRRLSAGVSGFVAPRTQARKRLRRSPYACAAFVSQQLEDRLLLSAITVTSLADSGAGSLRDAIDQANNNHGDDTITFASGLSGQTITLTSGQLELTDTTGATTIEGLGADQLTISGDNKFSVFKIQDDVTAEISDLTISHASAGPDSGGIFNEGTLTITDSVLSSNRSSNLGGGVYNKGTLTINNSTLSGNIAGAQGGGVYNHTDGTLTINNSTITGNHAEYGATNSSFGGGVFSNGTLTITNSTISDNTAGYGGAGGIYSGGTLTITNSTLSGNKTLSLGGGLMLRYGHGTITNCTFSGNTAEGGGGISNGILGQQLGGGTLTVTNCTFSGNTATSHDNLGGGIFNGGVSDAARLTLNNTIIANSIGGDDLVNRNFLFGSYNLVETGGIDGLSNTITGQDPLLGDLQDNGGPTFTFALLNDSRAINAGSTSLAVDSSGNPLTTDQRGDGFPRIFGGFVDLGAYELQTAPVITVTNLADSGSGSLRDALNQANSSRGADKIVFADGLSGQITLSGRLNLTDTTGTTTIEGLGADQLTVSGNGGDRVFEIGSGALAEISGLTIRDGQGDDLGGGGLRNQGTLTITDSIISNNTTGASGGGIVNSGTLTIIGTTIADNTATSTGGGVSSSGTLTMTSSIITGNEAYFGGGVHNPGGIATITDCTISNNAAVNVVAGGGGIFSSGTMTLASSTVSDNTSQGDAGGVFNSGTFTITNSTISGNTCRFDGGGIFTYNTLTLTNSTISGNTANLKGGGIFNAAYSGALSLANSTISGNSSAIGGAGIHNGFYSTVTLNNTIVANSSNGRDLHNNGGISGSNNLIENGDTDGLSNTITGQDPMLGDLQDNGGPTFTHALLQGSAAIDAGDNSLAVDSQGNPLTTDQRGDGFARENGTRVDIGAFESTFTSPAAVATFNPRTGALVVTGRHGADAIGLRGDGAGVVSVWVDTTGDGELDSLLESFQNVKSVRVDLGNGEDVVSIGGDLQLKKGLTVLGGAEADSVLFVQGDGSGEGFFGFTGTTSIDADVKLLLGNGDNQVTYDGTAFQKSVTIKLGNGPDEVSGVGATFAGKLGMILGDGDDILTHAGNTYHGAVSINLGAGDDAYAETEGTFRKKWTADGGRGLDTLDDHGVNLAVRTRHRNFENASQSLTTIQEDSLGRRIGRKRG